MSATGDDYIRNLGKPLPKGAPYHLCARRQPKLRQDHAVQPAHWRKSACWQFPGVTVDKKEGQLRRHPEATVVDLPGVYSLSPYSNEEVVTRDFLIKEKPTAIINIVDATNIERNLYLTLQLMEPTSRWCSR